jgi:hypothetical protein
LPRRKKIFRLAIHHKPDYIEARIRLAGLLRETARFDEAKLAYQEILGHHPDNSLAKLSLDIFCPGIFGSTLELNKRREEIESALDDYDPSSLGLDKKNVNNFPYPPIEMIHHGHNERPWRSKYADLFCQFFQAEHPEFTDNFSRKNSPTHRQGRPHIGIVVTHKHEGAFL